VRHAYSPIRSPSPAGTISHTRAAGKDAPDHDTLRVPDVDDHCHAPSEKLFTQGKNLACRGIPGLGRLSNGPCGDERLGFPAGAESHTLSRIESPLRCRPGQRGDSVAACAHLAGRPDDVPHDIVPAPRARHSGKPRPIEDVQPAGPGPAEPDRCFRSADADASENFHIPSPSSAAPGGISSQCSIEAAGVTTASRIQNLRENYIPVG
jgi:hypothetical protein